MPRHFWIETLGCPKNQVDSDKLVGTMLADGMLPASRPEDADLVVVNTCAFIDDARQESIDTILLLDGTRSDGAELVVTGCMAERYGQSLAQAMPEVEAVAPFGVAVSLGPTRNGSAASDGRAGDSSPNGVSEVLRIVDEAGRPVPSFDLLELPRPPASAPWAYVKVAEGCDRSCGFCAIPSFRGRQRSRTVASILAEIDGLGISEVVLVAQDLASFGRDQGRGTRQIIPLVQAAAERVARVRLLYLYPSDLSDELVDTICATGVPYFDLSLQHVSPPLMRRMRRWGSGPVFAERLATIRSREPDATFRSNFIVGYPGETEADHDLLLHFIEESRLDWCGFFAYSEEEGTYGATLGPNVPVTLVNERLNELQELQDQITAAKRDELIGRRLSVLVDSPGVGRSPREAPEIDGIVNLPVSVPVGEFVDVDVTNAIGPDLVAAPATVPA